MKLLSRPVGVIVACTVGNGVSITPMVYTVFGMFLIPMATEFAWPRAAVSFSLLVVAVAGALAYPVIGRLIDRHGARPVILAGNVLFAATVACASLIGPSRPELYGVYGLIGIAGAIPSSVMFTKVIAGWFDRGRGFAMGIAGGVGNGVGAALSGSFLGIAAVIVLIGFPVLFVLLWDPPGSYKDTAAGSALAGGMTPLEARSTSTFWIILVAIAIGAGCMTAVFAHVVPLLLDHGYSEERATAVLATFATVTAVWQVGVGRLIDRIPRPWIAAPFYLAALAGLILFHAAERFSQLMLAAALMGLGLGTEYGVLPYFLSRYFGVRHYGAISGTIYAVIVLAQGLTPFLMDLSFDRTGSYRSSMVVIGAGLIASALLILRLQPFSAVAAAQIPQKS